MNSSASEKGFVLPVAIGVGLIAILLGIMVVARSSQNRITATAQRETARSLAAAETGITKFQSLFDQYRPLTTYCSTTAICATSVTWNSAAPTDLALAPDMPCDSSATSQVQSFAASNWQNISSDPNDGQFRLVSYAFDKTGATLPQLGLGTLIIDGRVNANGADSNSARISTTRLKVQFKVNDGSAAAGTLPGLWIKDEAGSSTDASPTNTLNTKVRSSACSPGSTFLNVLSIGNSYEAAPGESLPALPKAGLNLGNFGSVTSSRGVINSSTSLIPKPDSNRFTYEVAKGGDGLSINLTGGNSLVVEDLPSAKDTSPVKITYVLYLEGGMSLDAKSQIKVAPNSKLIMYVHGPVTLAGDSTIQPIVQEGTATSENVQIFVYPSGGSGPDVNISDSTGLTMSLALLAPNSKVQMTGAQIAGLVWAQSWVGSGGANITQPSLTASALEGVTFLPRITPITSWQRQPLN